MLANEDVAVLLKALDAYKAQASSQAMMSLMLTAMISKKDDDAEFERKADEKMENAKRETEAIEEVIILLKAKLIQMRDRSTVDEMSAVLKSGR